ncbi:zinc ABC transporter solute-binding protein (plasmid) [Rhodobacteraceae bacterium SC52]|nr:zinc ABC transporter solute-binding protein [Rhodobacteraceae bacterium SC52]
MSNSVFAALVGSTFMLSALSVTAAPRVAVDIPPVHSLVAQVMEGVGAPELLISGGSSPHGYALRPSEARVLQSADLVVWVGQNLTPWLGLALPKLAGNATVIELAEVPETHLLGFRDSVVFDASSDQHDEGHDDHEDHAEHDDHDHDDHHEDEDEHDHDHSGYDPHMWLDPDNASAWLGVIAAELSNLDPENAALYVANAKAGQANLEQLSAEIDTLLDPVHGGRYVVFHDGYQYFGQKFDMPAAGAIRLSDASDPSPARIAEIRAAVQEGDIACVFSEPQFNPALINPVFEGTEARVVVADPLGALLDPGPSLYGVVLRDLASGLAKCLQ